MSKPLFFRTEVVPIELRSSKNSKACYGKHTHEEFSIGTVDSGVSYYFNSNFMCRIQAGSIVIMNPLEVHSCNPIKGTAWSYQMLYVCPEWLGQVQSMVMGRSMTGFVPFAVCHLVSSRLYNEFQALSNILKNGSEILIEEASISFFSHVFSIANAYPLNELVPRKNVSKAYEYIRANYKNNISIKDIASYSNLSEFHLIHSFRKVYGITPHAVQIVLRINEAKKQLKKGNKISSIATDLGFTDQSHFHRNFKKIVAATPVEYQNSSLGLL